MLEDAPKDRVPLALTFKEENLSPREAQLLRLLVVGIFETQMNAATWCGQQRPDLPIDLANRLTELLRRLLPDLEARFGVELKPV